MTVVLKIAYFFGNLHSYLKEQRVCPLKDKETVEFSK